MKSSPWIILQTQTIVTKRKSCGFSNVFWDQLLNVFNYLRNHKLILAGDLAHKNWWSKLISHVYYITSIHTWMIRSFRSFAYPWWSWLTFRSSLDAASFMELITSSWAWRTLIREALSCMEYSLQNPIKEAVTYPHLSTLHKSLNKPLLQLPKWIMHNYRNHFDWAPNHVIWFCLQSDSILGSIHSSPHPNATWSRAIGYTKYVFPNPNIRLIVAIEFLHIFNLLSTLPN